MADSVRFNESAWSNGCTLRPTANNEGSLKCDPYSSYNAPPPFDFVLLSPRRGLSSSTPLLTTLTHNTYVNNNAAHIDIHKDAGLHLISAPRARTARRRSHRGNRCTCFATRQRALARSAAHMDSDLRPSVTDEFVVCTLREFDLDVRRELPVAMTHCMNRGFI